MWTLKGIGIILRCVPRLSYITTMSPKDISFSFRLTLKPRKMCGKFYFGYICTFFIKKAWVLWSYGDGVGLVEFGVALHWNFLATWNFKSLTLSKGVCTWGSGAWWPCFDQFFCTTYLISLSTFDSGNCTEPRNWTQSTGWSPSSAKCHVPLSSMPSDNGSPWSVAMFLCGEQFEMFDKVQLACHRFLPPRTAAAINLTSLQELKLKTMSWLYFSK